MCPCCYGSLISGILLYVQDEADNSEWPGYRRGVTLFLFNCSCFRDPPKWLVLLASHLRRLLSLLPSIKMAAARRDPILVPHPLTKMAALQWANKLKCWKVSRGEAGGWGYGCLKFYTLVSVPCVHACVRVYVRACSSLGDKVMVYVAGHYRYSGGNHFKLYYGHSDQSGCSISGL